MAFFKANFASKFTLWEYKSITAPSVRDFDIKYCTGVNFKNQTLVWSLTQRTSDMGNCQWTSEGKQGLGQMALFAFLFRSALSF